MKNFLNFLNKDVLKKPKLLFYTYANKKYYRFAILYPLYVLYFNKEAAVEIALEDEKFFRKQYGHLIEFYEKKYKGRVLFHQLDMKKDKKIFEGSYRFITKPRLVAEYVYIGDVDIFVLDDVFMGHLKNIDDNNLDFSNIKRKDKNRLSGLHFIEYNKMYPIGKINPKSIGDEELLHLIMKNKGYKIPPESLEYRPIFGLHVSFWSRPLFNTMTTKDEIINFPAWFSENDNSCFYASIYQKIRYNEYFLKFFANLKENDVEVRQIIQIVDIATAYYLKNFQDEEASNL